MQNDTPTPQSIQKDNTVHEETQENFIDESSEGEEENEEHLMQKLDEIGESGRSKNKTFEGIPK